ncbi:NADH-dependent flavin oxidoreductase [Bordetella genomosp. 10]|uniref:NADH-dependent flavin oxidoreductase n=1 Tax=Bordetella genomosp. 10 TaxID=1416804 RepID=A0A261SMN4_9BORD|nr:NADH:flavin oxidoreductase [Bordetella genomosp. 10]OZI38669.1 NADH-dependent flavin oxidoreductase [Bordetella genomosp. 10]
MQNNSFQALAPLSLAGLPLRNRLAVAPMSRMQGSPEGLPSPDCAAYYARYARHGAALVITEALYTDEIASRAYFNQPGLSVDRHADAWRPVTDAVHAEGAKIFAQLQHAGRLAEPGLNGLVLGATGRPAAGNTWQTESPNPVPRAATEDDLERIVSGFADAARRAAAAGFDGIELHGARGYLIHESLNDDNDRGDGWGGALDGRMRLATRILAAVKAASGGLPVGFNYSMYSMDDYGYKPGAGVVELEALFRGLRRAGADILHISTRRTLRPEPWGETLARTAARCAPGPLIAGGGLTTLDDCEQVFALSESTIVALARPFLANPDWIRRSLAGEPLRAYVPGMERAALMA